MRPLEISITRLAIYLRFLENYLKEKGSQSTINSSQLAEYLDINPHQIRKDISYFGKFGERSLGYRAQDLKDKVSRILGLDRHWKLCICGMGNQRALYIFRFF